MGLGPTVLICSSFNPFLTLRDGNITLLSINGGWWTIPVVWLQLRAYPILPALYQSDIHIALPFSEDTLHLITPATSLCSAPH